MNFINALSNLMSWNCYLVIFLFIIFKDLISFNSFTLVLKTKYCDVRSEF